MSFEEFYDEFNEAGKVLYDDRKKAVKVAKNSAEDGTEKRIAKRKPSLKTMLCIPIGFFIGFFSDSLVEFLFLYCLFSLYTLLPD